MSDVPEGNEEPYPLDVIQEHYFKRELLKFQLEQEFEKLNDKDALRKFGYPFTADDPKKSGANSTTDSLDSDSSRDLQFPLISYLLRRFVMTFPLFAKNVSIDETFWQTKVQVFFEHFTDLHFSDSYDLEQATKRKRIGQKFSKLILLLFNSGIGSENEVTYYDKDKGFSLNNGTRKRSKIEEFTIPTRESLQALITNEPIFINNWDINVIALIDDSILAGMKPLLDVSTPVSGSPASSFRTNTLKSTSKWMKDTFAFQNSRTSLFSKLSITNSTTSAESVTTNTKGKKIKFIVKLRAETSGTAIHIVKSYKNFKKLSTDLNVQFPGKKLPHLPHKIKKKHHLHKISSSVSVNSKSLTSTPKSRTSSQFEYASEEPLDADDETEIELQEQDDEVFEEEEEIGYRQLLDDKLRTSLRQYLRSLCKDKEVASSTTLSHFFNTDKISSIEDLANPEIKLDIKRRETLDVNNLETQLKFQKLALEKSLILQDSMKDFKTNLLKDDSYLLGLAQEIKEKKSITELSPIFQNFIEWFKIYLASLIYQTFIGEDNSYGLYTQIKKLHKLMPYTMMEQIVKFTNPMAIMKGMIDLFMVQPPQILGGGQSLLQTMFSTILTDDLKVYKGRVKDLEDLIIKESGDKTLSSNIVKCLKSFVFKDKSVKDINMDDIHSESAAMNMPTVLIVLMKCVDLDLVSNEAVSQVIESYTSWKISMANKSTSAGEIEKIDDNSLYFQHVKELFILYIKEHDKRLMRQLWQDPELLALLKASITLIYEPMVRVFKVAKMDVALRNFERFMTDLIKLLDMIIEGRTGASTEFNIIDSIYNLLSKHQESFFEFLHDVYINDEEKIFEGFIMWFGSIIKFLQTSKFGSMDKRISFNAIIIENKDEIDIDKLKAQIDRVVNKKINARKLYKEFVDMRTQSESSLNINGNTNSNKKTKQDMEQVMGNKWKQINENVIPNNVINMGLAEGELVDLDIDTKDLDYLQGENGTNMGVDMEQKYKAIVNEEIDESEIKKFATRHMTDILKQALQ